MGLTSVVAPLFEVRPVEWSAPDPAAFDAVLFTSANALRCAGSTLAAFSSLPCYCVGEATGAEATKVGFRTPVIGPGDGEALLRMMAEDGRRATIHFCGRDHIDLRHPELSLTRVVVYAAIGADRLPDDAIKALRSGALALLHSPRAGRLFGTLVDAAGLDRSAIRIAAISKAAADAAGGGWAAKVAAAEPRDQALLELAAKLCNKDDVSGTGMAG